MSTTKKFIVAGGHGEGHQLYQLNQATDVLVDNKSDSLIICDGGNRRVVRWSRQKGKNEGELWIDNIRCWGLAMDDERNLYVSDTEKHQVKRYTLRDRNGTIIAVRYGKGTALNQLNMTTFLFVDRENSLYISERNNHRVTKWTKDATQGIVVAGGNGNGKGSQSIVVI